MHEREQVAADDRRGHLARRDRSNVGVVGVARHLPGGALHERLERGIPGEGRALGDAHRAQAWTMHRGQARALADRDVQVRDVGVPHERLGVRRDQVVVEVRQQLHRAGAAPEHLDDVDLGVGEQRVEVGRPLLGGAGDVVVLGPDAVAELHAEAALLPPLHRSFDVAAVVVRATGRADADRAAGRQRGAEHGGGDVRHAAVVDRGPPGAERIDARTRPSGA